MAGFGQPVDPLVSYASRDLVDLAAPDAEAHIELVETCRLLARRVLVLERVLRDAGVDLEEVLQ